MENNQEGNAEKFMKDFGKRLDQFMVELKEAGTRVGNEMESKVADLKDAGERLRKEVENKQKWAEVEASLKKASDALENAIKKAFQ